MPEVPKRNLSLGEKLELKKKPKISKDRFPNLYYAKIGNLWYALRPKK